MYVHQYASALVTRSALGICSIRCRYRSWRAPDLTSKSRVSV